MARLGHDAPHKAHCHQSSYRATHLAISGCISACYVWYKHIDFHAFSRARRIAFNTAGLGMRQIKIHQCPHQHLQMRCLYHVLTSSLYLLYPDTTPKITFSDKSDLLSHDNIVSQSKHCHSPEIAMMKV